MNNSLLTTDDILRENGLQKLCLSTTTKQMNILGYKYETRKKCYYVDNHQSEIKCIISK